ncbi:hypothetical protein FPOAC2_14199 [Fusarium poae]|uniref:uncharacterized protein n=1 Tax=Fusarium poae TaxID=36050 RepID=UPI001D038E10|nr:uncharacterized protein FPOAC1_013976 [Fusarium poae]KAG8664269.1 hypothetical protein FPOAC1_013976 [Fusarium poae]
MTDSANIPESLHKSPFVNKHNREKEMDVITAEQPSTLDDCKEPPHTLQVSDKPFVRTPETKIEDLPGELPVSQIDASVDPEAVAELCVRSLNSFDPSVVAKNAIWRDLFALSGTLRTMYGVDTITSTWKDVFAHHQMSDFELMPGTSKIVRLGPKHSWIAARFTFRTNGIPASLCSGQIGIVPFEGKWQIWMMTSILEELQGLPNPDFLTDAGMKSVQNTHENGIDYEAVVVGAGFAGLCVAGRMKAMGVHYLLIDKNPKIGDNWTARYDSARFHTDKYYSDMPLGPIFRHGYDPFLSSSDLARGYREYANKIGLHTCLSTVLRTSKFDDVSETWTLSLETDGRPWTLKTSNVVFATGAGGATPNWPVLADRSVFEGKLLHSVDYKNASDWGGKKGVVIGSANTAHDIAEDMLAANMTVTMVQRGRTPVIPRKYHTKWSNTLYNPTIPIEESDRQVMATPLAVTRLISLFGQQAQAAQEAERFDSLERRGFRCERNADFWKLLTSRFGGHYIDVGASQKIADGLIAVKSGAKIQSLTKTGLLFDDGSSIDADVIVVCTGFKTDMLEDVSKMVEPEVVEKLDHYWGLDEEGELRGAFKPLQHPGIYLIGGGVTHARFYSRFIALQIKASSIGSPLKVFKKGGPQSDNM